MKKIFVLLALFCSVNLFAQVTDSLFLSNLYITHIIFPTEATYVDISNPKVVKAKIVEENKHVVAIRSMESFTDPCSVTVLQSNGTINTFIVNFESTPKDLIIDMSASAQKQAPVRSSSSRSASPLRSAAAPSKDNGAVIAGAGGTIAPTLESVLKEDRQVYHIGDKEYGIAAYCYNVFVYNDIIYLVLNLTNGSNISYKTGDPEFAVENKVKNHRQIEYSNKIVQRSHFGSLCAASKGSSNAVYCFDKFTLNNDQVFKAYIYEDGGQRNLTLVFSAKDFNNARQIQ